MRFLRRFFIRLSNLRHRTGAPTSASRKRSPNILPCRRRRTCAPVCRPPRRGGRPHSSSARRRRYGKATTPSKVFHFIENLLFDLRYAFRMLRRSPGFSFIAIATMALGVGATTAIYSVIDATLLHPLPYPHPSELVRIEANLPGVGAHDIGLSIPELRDLQNSGIFQYVSLRFFGTDNLTGSAQPTRIAGKSVSPGYFAVLGVDAQLGRTFDPHDATPGFNNEVVISDGLWKRAFGADPHILGKTSAH